MTFCAILLLATGCTSPKKTHTADPLRVGTIVVTPSSDIDAALYVGTIEEETSAALSFPVAGTVARTYADEGQRVQQGQLLAELDPTSARQTFDAAQAALDQAKDACARLKQLYALWSGSRDFPVRHADLQEQESGFCIWTSKEHGRCTRLSMYLQQVW